MALGTQYDLLCRGSVLLTETCNPTDGNPLRAGRQRGRPLVKAPSSELLLAAAGEGALRDPRGGAPDAPNAPGDPGSGSKPRRRREETAGSPKQTGGTGNSGGCTYRGPWRGGGHAERPSAKDEQARQRDRRTAPGGSRRIQSALGRGTSQFLKLRWSIHGGEKNKPARSVDLLFGVHGSQSLSGY